MRRLLVLLFFCGALFASGALASPALAEDGVIRIGVLTDLSGSMAGAAGRGSIEAATMAAEDVRAATGLRVTIVTADYQSRGGLARHISRDWIRRQNIDMVADVPNAAIAARLRGLFHREGKILLTSTPRRPEAASVSCEGTALHWLYGRDTMTENLIRALVAEGKRRWFILGGENPHAAWLAASAKGMLRTFGAEIVGEAYLRRRMGGLRAIAAQIRKTEADIVLLSFERPEILHLLRRWPPPPDGRTPPLAFGSLPFSDLYDLKRVPMPPFYTLASFYWDQNDHTRAFAKRFAGRNRGMMPTAIHASVYSAVRHYLQAVDAAQGRTAAGAVLAQMRARPLRDSLFDGGHVRRDGVVIHRLNLLSSKKPEDRGGPFDLFRVVHSMPPEELVLPPQACPDAPPMMDIPDKPAHMGE